MKLSNLIILLIIAVPILLISSGFIYYVGQSKFASTENAYVKAKKIVVSSEVPGRVGSIFVDENNTVKKGQLLFRLEPETYLIALEKAEAKLARVQQDLKALQDQYRKTQAELRRAEGETSFFKGQLERQKKLRAKGVSSQASLDDSERNFFASRERSNATREELSRLLTMLGGNLNIHEHEHPIIREAIANKRIATLNLRKTQIFAPVDSVVTNFDLNVGEQIEAGRPVFSLIVMDEMWVEANFKETDLTNVHKGQPAIIKIDAFPDVALSAHVIGISPATGSEFSLLPAQNATGNWVKVVQRLPVRLKFDKMETPVPLRAGMTVSVSIDTGKMVTLPIFLSPIYNLFEEGP